MFICDDCLRDSCDGFHMLSSFGPCEGCGKTKGTWDCRHYKRDTEALSLDQVRLRMLEHLRRLVGEARAVSKGKAARVSAQVACARDMCRIAGIPETVIESIFRYPERRF